MSAVINITGQRFGKLVALHPSTQPERHKRWHCKCDCGADHIVRSDQLRAGQVHSCGCAGHPAKHGFEGQRIYRVWCHMRARCGHPGHVSYKDYGGRGIKVCKAWENAASFIGWAHANGYSAGLQLDRIDNDKGYWPSNCRFVTCKINNRNRRNTVIVEWRGRRIPLTELAEISGLKEGTLRRRIFDIGLSPELAVSLPCDSVATQRFLRERDRPAATPPTPR